MITTTVPSLAKAAIVRVPAEAVGPGVIPAPGSRIMLRAGDRFMAQWSKSDEVGLCCEVLCKRGKKYECRVLNGMWRLTFDEEGLANYGGSTAVIVMLLPKKLVNVADMDNWDRVAAVVEQQLRKAARKKKPAVTAGPAELRA